jgi:hypothetical protein
MTLDLDCERIDIHCQLSEVRTTEFFGYAAIGKLSLRAT